MKNRSFCSRGEVEMVASRGNKSNFKRKMKNKQRLGGEGLSLHAFANAKSNNSYNPNLIKKQREMYKNAKIVKKFKKSLKQQNQMECSMPTTSMVQVSQAEDPGMGANEQRAKAKKKKVGLQSLREEYEQRREEMEKARKEREAMIQAKEEEKARAESKRKTLRQTMFKKTRSGQPVMKYRIEHLLKGIKEDQHL